MSLKLALLSLIVLSPVAAVAQTKSPAPYTAKAATPVVQSAPGHSPLDTRLLPYLKKHLAVSATKSSKPSAMAKPNAGSSTNGQPNFGGYVMAPFYPARLQSSCIGDAPNCGVSVELAADFDKDGKPDLAVVQSNGTLNLLINSGTGAFLAPVSYLNPNYSSTFIGQAFAVDVNNDGYADIVEFDLSNNTLIVYLNQKNGTFGAAQTTTLDFTYGYANSIAIGDVDKDGSLDVVVISTNQLAQNSTAVTVETYLGSGTGSFNAPTPAGTQTATIPAYVQIPAQLGITLGDINKDGKLDLAADLEEQTAQTTGAVVATIALGNGDGSFAPINVNVPISIPVTAPPGFPFIILYSSGVQIADLNNDGNPDVAIDQLGVVEVALGSGSGTFTSTVETDMGGSDEIVYADANGDGILDLIQDDGVLNIWTGKGDGTFTIPINGASYSEDPNGENALAVADFNGDGNPDIARLGGTYSQVSIFAGNGKGSFYGAPILSSTTDGANNPSALILVDSGDIAGNGLTDLIFIDTSGINPDIVSALSDGKGGFTWTTALAATAVPNLAFVQPTQADFNGDGKDDLLIAGSDGSLSVSLSNGDGTFQAPVKLNLPSTDCVLSYGVTGDLNGDGHADIVVTYPGDAACGGSDSTPSGYFVALGKGDGTFATPTFTAAGNELYSAAIADINLDGVQDLILNDEPFDGSGPFTIDLLTGNGDGTFSAANSVYSNYLVSWVIAGDYNQDGKPDLILFDEGEFTDIGYSGSLDTAGIILLPGNGDGTFDASSQLGLGNQFLNGVLTDVNHDGIPDIVTSFYSSDTQSTTYFGLTTLLGTGKGSFAPPVNALDGAGAEYTVVGNFSNDNSTGAVAGTGEGPAFFLGRGGSSFALTTSGSSIVFGQSETLTAALTATLASQPAPTGTVSFYDGTTLLGTATVSDTTATYTTSSLAVGSHSITAVYSGDSSFNPNTSAATSVAVTALAPAFSLTANPGTASITVGQQAVATLTLTANATFSGSISFTCSGLPANAACIVNPTQVTLAAGSTEEATVIIGTTTSAANIPPPFSPLSGYVGGLSVAGLFCCFAFRRFNRKLFSALGLLFVVSAMAGLSGCSSGNGVKTVAKGTYTATITATPSGSSAATQTATIAVTVQ